MISETLCQILNLDLQPVYKNLIVLISLPYCFLFIFSLIQLLSEGQAGEAKET
jgi:hypothetical protein